MFITVINDCRSPNEKGRQETRLHSLFGFSVSFVGVQSDFSVNATLEAAGNLIDVLDAAEDREGIILVNVAPRGEQGKDGHNGTAFCYFYFKKTLVISTVRGHSLSLVKKLGLVETVRLMDVATVCAYADQKELLSHELATYIPTTQFRSFDFVPRVAYWLHKGYEIPHTNSTLDIIEDIPPCIWYIDAFGNCKTSILSSEVRQSPGTTIETNLGSFKYYQRLKDLPKGETAFYTGSSGIDGRRFIEIATQMKAGSAAKTLDLSLGTEIQLH